ncbi:MAG: late competence development ComFB family protein [Treponema sp.]|nr:late competence development ComFB family protein [Treponema sp.]
MEIHNITEDMVFSSIQTIFDSFQKKGNPDQFCTCEQCRVDIACYVLNRCTPRYIVSNRGVTRLKQDDLEWQQLEADIAALINDCMRRIKHNRRATAQHDNTILSDNIEPGFIYNIPVIMGRIFDGATFAPLAGVTAELRSNGELVPMIDKNWQNPYTLVSNTAGSYTFWPKQVTAGAADDHKIFEYFLTITAPDYETVTHYFRIPAISQPQSAVLFSIERTFKLPDLYLFPPGEDEQNG